MSKVIIADNNIKFKDSTNSIVGEIVASRVDNHPLLDESSVGLITFRGNSVNSPGFIKRLISYPVSASVSSGILQLDLSTSNSFHVTLSGSLTSVSFNNPSVGQSGVLILKHTTATSYSVSWELDDSTTGVHWQNATNPTLSSTANTYNFINFYCVSSSVILLGFHRAASSSSTSIYETPATQSSDSNFVVSSLENKFILNQIVQPILHFTRNSVYTFNVSHSRNTTNIFTLSSTDDGTHNSGTAYTSDISLTGSLGTSGSYSTFSPISTTPDVLYYYDPEYSNAGNSITISDDQTSEFTIVVSKTNVFYLNGIEQPTLFLKRGKTYIFDTTNSSNSSFDFSLSKYPEGVDDGTTYPDLLDSNNSIFISFDLPNILYYFSTTSTGLGNKIHLDNQLSHTHSIIKETNMLKSFHSTYLYSSSSATPSYPLGISLSLLEQVVTNSLKLDGFTISVDFDAFFPTVVDTSSADTYFFNFTSTDFANNVRSFNAYMIVIGNYILKDTTIPTISSTSSITTSFSKTKFIDDILSTILSSATDYISDTNGIYSIAVLQHNINPDVEGTYSITLRATDAYENTADFSLTNISIF